ncbi:MAG: SUKH-3 domain-containing protein [Lachnospiraceae bacterium]|nr:SUKH-3 domain-containing protein [Lachnospiraceae bacterium]
MRVDKKYNYYFEKYLSEVEIISDEHESIAAWVKVLMNEGYVYNDYADEILSIFGGLKVRGRGETSKNYVEIYFNPVFFASGEYDRMSIYNSLVRDSLFPVGGLYDYTIFIGKKGKYYIADWKDMYECGNSVDSFIHNIFMDAPNLLELTESL